MQAEHFRSWLRGRLEADSQQVLLRILVSRTCPAPVEMTGAQILRRSLELAQLAAATPERGVVLLRGTESRSDAGHMNCRLPIADCRLPNADLSIVGCKIVNRKSEIGNRKSEIAGI